MKMVSLAVIVVPALVLAGTALALRVEPGLAGLTNPGAHGLSQALYALTSAGTLATNNGLFVVLLVAAVLLVGALNYVPALALGPVAEHLTLMSGR